MFFEWPFISFSFSVSSAFRFPFLPAGICLTMDIPQFLKTMDTNHNSVNLAAKVCSDICPWTLSVPRSSLFGFFGTDDVAGQICEHIFAPNEGYCLYIYIFIYSLFSMFISNVRICHANLFSLVPLTAISSASIVNSQLFILLSVGILNIFCRFVVFCCYLYGSPCILVNYQPTYHITLFFLSFY